MPSISLTKEQIDYLDQIMFELQSSYSPKELAEEYTPVTQGCAGKADYEEFKRRFEWSGFPGGILYQSQYDLYLETLRVRFHADLFDLNDACGKYESVAVVDSRTDDEFESTLSEIPDFSNVPEPAIESVLLPTPMDFVMTEAEKK